MYSPKFPTSTQLMLGTSESTVGANSTCWSEQFGREDKPSPSLVSTSDDKSSQVAGGSAMKVAAKGSAMKISAKKAAAPAPVETEEEMSEEEAVEDAPLEEEEEEEGEFTPVEEAEAEEELEEEAEVEEEAEIEEEE